MEAQNAHRVHAEDLELLHTLCSVWVDGPLAQQYYDTRDPKVAPQAAREVRMAIEASVIYDCELSLDHLTMLRRIEATLESEPRGCPSVVSRFLRAALAIVCPAIHAIRGVLPSRPPFG